MHALYRWSFIGTAAALFAGCGGDGGGSAADLLDESAQATSLACECWMELGYDSREDCAEPDDISGLTPDERRCVLDLYERNVDALDPTFSCFADAYAQLTECIRRVPDCERASLVACAQQYGPEGSVASSCPPVPEALEAELDACFP